jgi:hypothetical protein
LLSQFSLALAPAFSFSMGLRSFLFQRYTSLRIESAALPRFILLQVKSAVLLQFSRFFNLSLSSLSRDWIVASSMHDCVDSDSFEDSSAADFKVGDTSLDEIRMEEKSEALVQKCEYLCSLFRFSWSIFVAFDALAVSPALLESKDSPDELLSFFLVMFQYLTSSDLLSSLVLSPSLGVQTSPAEKTCDLERISLVQSLLLIGIEISRDPSSSRIPSFVSVHSTSLFLEYFALLHNHEAPSVYLPGYI